MSDPPPSSSSASSSSSSSASSSSGGSSSSASSSASSSSSSSGSHGLSSGAVAITASFVVVGGVVLIVLAVLIIKYVQKKMLETTSGGDVGGPVESGDSKNVQNMEQHFVVDSLIEKPKKFTSKELEILTDNYREKLGSGGFGDVYRGGVIRGKPSAVKIFRGNLRESAVVQFIAELETLGRTYHDNLVSLCGYCFDDKTKALVYEYMENGSLDGYLKSGNIKWQQLYEIAVGTAKGLQYLHEDCHPQIIHYDIKPANILLSQNWSPKIADFGMAEMFEKEKALDTIKKNSMPPGKGTPGFAAPEIWTPGYSGTPKCDVYSFGKVLFSMLWSTWDLKFKEQQQDLDELTFQSWVRKKVDGKELGSVISNCGNEEDREKIRIMCEVAVQCVEDGPGKRPSMSEVVNLLLRLNTSS